MATTKSTLSSRTRKEFLFFISGVAIGLFVAGLWYRNGWLLASDFLAWAFIVIITP